MKKLLIATHNQGKVRELGELLEPLGIDTISAAGLDLPEPIEDADTFHGNAKLKSIPAAKAANLPALADDSGLCIPALDGKPGIHSARWGGPEKDFTMATERIKQELLKKSPLLSGNTKKSPPYQGGLGGCNPPKRRPHNPDNIEKARELRKGMTEAEKILWSKLKSKQLNAKFRKQEPLGDYIVDFICLEKKLIIELDGGGHSDQQEYDDERTEFLEDSGYRVIRFWNNDVIENLEGVIEDIQTHLDTPPSPPDRGGLVGEADSGGLAYPSGVEAYFICVLSLAQPDGTSIEFEGRINGTLTFPARGKNGFGYDPIFIPEHDTRTFGEMSQLEKNQRNHRADAFKKLVTWLHSNVVA